MSGSSQGPSGSVGWWPPAMPPMRGSAYTSMFMPNATWSETSRRSNSAALQQLRPLGEVPQSVLGSAEYDGMLIDSCIEAIRQVNRSTPA
ncbi:hypothetical protein, partial [Mycobacterium tilburgii]|uniref:hypothetical protein n=1 Tax=Mycobacterium tilburgii TaxID=44467 RepID=UPI0038991B5B